MKATGEIDRLIRAGINKEHFHRKDDQLDTPLRGSVAFVAKVLRSQVVKILDFDLSQTPFLLYGVEIAGNVRIRMPEGDPVNMRFAIDRLDKVKASEERGDEERLRVVDYKTGSVHVESDSMLSVFEGDRKGRNLIQLWLYANLFDALPDKRLKKDCEPPILTLFGNGNDLPNQPLMLELYDVNNMKRGKHTYPKVEGKVQTVHADKNGEFLDNLEDSLIRLFDPSEPFNPPADLNSCDYCAFKTMCWR